MRIIILLALTISIGIKAQIKDIEGQNYKIVVIGSQTWMAENLNVTTFRNGDIIPEAKTDEEWRVAGNNQQPVWCYYDNDPKNGEKYGKLYNYQNFNSTLVYEYPLDHDYKTTIPFYPINSEENSKIHKEYVEITNRKFPNMFLSGRLADYKYFNMDQVIAKSLTLFDSLNN